jgi:Mg-chelatase subunit ChlD
MKNKSGTTGGFKNRTVHNLIILDESGSMQAIKAATVQGFNEVVQTVKGFESQFPEQEHFVSLVTFNGLGIKAKLFAKKVKTLSEIDANIYQPDASTPLYDAIGFSVNKLRQKLSSKTDYNVLVTILTDGEENASREYSGAAINQLISELKNDNWTFTYIGANHDVEKVAASISITNTLRFEANPADVKRAFDADKKARGVLYSKVRREESVRDDYFQEEEQPGK